ncbi:ImmA/IrrE family metallo-endopeptidase [Enterococcus sp. 5B3_DIV0040]|uniref:ImmA/IrrE family metallo-endopeptidase n=1 Tax=Enterococcus sp. 5B3_DIV0040 TaxID=1834182 RepID=UPI000A34E8F5|nr:ImmA/IrrE family metallo-endopeptidase [Enterococcus sp. 5B3_DIV0040]OTO03232.1 hypothetical protein A5883_000197 [Enterococcus sp. 5B3_DIV0040]
MVYKKRSTKEIQEEVTQLSNQALQAVKEYTQSPEEQLRLMAFMQQFYQYSFRNQLMILAQYPGATAIGNYRFFAEKGFYPRQDQKGKSIRILQPNFYSLFQDENGVVKSIKKATNEEKVKIHSKELKSWEVKSFRPTSVWDITQTTATPEDYPKLFPNRPSEFPIHDEDMLKSLEEGIKRIATALHVPIHTEQESILGIHQLGVAKGCFAYALDGTKEIVLSQRNTPSERIHVLIHELAHAALHDPTVQGDSLYTTKDKILDTPSLKEFQAELVSYIVNKHYGIDTAEETTPYLAHWTKHLTKIEAQEEAFQIQLLEEVQRTSQQFIQTIDSTVTPLLERYQEKESFLEKYALTNDPAFTKEDREFFYQLSQRVNENQLLSKLSLHRNETIVSWSFDQSKAPETITRYKDELALHLQKKIIDGHPFYQVDEQVELLLVPDKEQGNYDLWIMDQVGDITTYSVPTQEEAYKKLQELGAFPVPQLSSLKQLVEHANHQYQQQLIHNQVMRNTYERETGRSMT